MKLYDMIPLSERDLEVYEALGATKSVRSGCMTPDARKELLRWAEE